MNLANIGAVVNMTKNIIPLDFDKRQKLYNKTWLHLQYSWKKNYEMMVAALHLLKYAKCDTIVEMGCHDGGLAVTCLRALERVYKQTNVYEWTGYDITETVIKNSRWHPHYNPILLTKYLWDEPDIEPFDIFITCHVLEHLYSEEIIKLAQWLSTRAKYLILFAPLGYRSSSIRAVKSGHILEKGRLWVSDVLKSVGFISIWETNRYFGWFKHKDVPSC